VGVLVVGAGGHAKVVVDVARAAGVHVAGVLGHPGDPAEVLGVPVSFDRTGIDAESFVIALGDNARRAAAFVEYLEVGLAPATIVHPSAIIGTGVELGGGTVVVAGAVINADATIGANVILNTGCTIDHDCVIGDHAHIGPGVNLCGGVRVGEGALLGVGACAIPLAEIGAWSVVGAGSAVTDKVPPRCVWGGVPARQLRAESEAE